MTDRITARLDHLAPLEPPPVRAARAALRRAQCDLHDLLRRGADVRIVDAARYRVKRAHDLLEQRWHDAALTACR